MSDQELNDRIRRLTAALIEATSERDSRRVSSNELARQYVRDENAGRVALGFPVRPAYL
jgi:hypothetical protein